MIDISPASLGSPDNVNASYYPSPEAFDTYDSFYDTLAGGDPSTGYTVNPATGAPLLFARTRYPLGSFSILARWMAWILSLV